MSLRLDEYSTKTAAQLDGDNPLLFGHSDSNDGVNLTPAEAVKRGCLDLGQATPDDVIASLSPSQWYNAEEDNVTVEAATGIVQGLTDLGSEGADIPEHATEKGYWQRGCKLARPRVRLNGTLLNSANPTGTTKTIFHVAAVDRYESGHPQALFVSGGLMLEYYNNTEFRTWFDPNPGGWVYSATEGGFPMPNVPFLFTGFTQGTAGYGGSLGPGTPTLRTNNGGAAAYNGGAYIGRGTSSANYVTGSFFEHVEFARKLSDAEILLVQNALAEKHRLWRFAPSPFSIRMSAEQHAHRCGLDGFAANEGENTITAAKAAVKHGCDGWEVDTYLNADGTTYLIHDNTVDRTTDGTGTVASKTDAQMDALTVNGTTESPPALEAFLTAVKPYHLPVMLNVKDGAGYTSANTAVVAAGFDKKLLRTLLPVSNRSNWVSTFPEAEHFGLNDTLPTDFDEALAFIAARKAEGLSGSLLEWYQVEDYLLRAAEATGFKWFVHQYRGNPQSRMLGMPGYVDFLEDMEKG